MYSIPVNVEPSPEPRNKCQHDETQKLKGEIPALKKQAAYLSRKGKTIGYEIKVGKNSKESEVTGDRFMASPNVLSDSTSMPGSASSAGKMDTLQFAAVSNPTLSLFGRRIHS